VRNPVLSKFSTEDGNVGYARAKHKNKQGFHYHKYSIEYAIEKLGELSRLDQGQYKSIDPYLSNSSSHHKLMAGGEGFEPSTPNLGGWCSIRDESFSPSTSPFASARDPPIRAELLAHSINLHYNLDINTLLKANFMFIREMSLS
jgi:hypothetical protein